MFTQTVLKGSKHGRDFALDIHWNDTGLPKPVIIFIHGFKGFKDWGTFNLIAREFARRHYVFVKVNLSHNGVTPEQPVDFVDLKAFAENTISKELEDIDDAITFVASPNFPVPLSEEDTSRIIPLGHSRGGSVSYIKARHDERVSAVAGWASPCDLENRWPDSMLMEWEEKGIYYLPNSRTGQLMPLNYSIVQDYRANQSEFHIPSALKEMTIPVLHIHGTKDESVFLQEVKMVLRDLSNVQFEIIEEANHTFGGSHPYTSEALPVHTVQLIEITDRFLKS